VDCADRAARQSRNLSQAEIEKLLDSRDRAACTPLFRKCALAVLIPAARPTTRKKFSDLYQGDFEVELVRQAWGIKLEIKNAPARRSVDGEDDPRHEGARVPPCCATSSISNEIIEAAGSTLPNPAAITKRGCSTS